MNLRPVGEYGHVVNMPGPGLPHIQPGSRGHVISKFRHIYRQGKFGLRIGCIGFGICGAFSGLGGLDDVLNCSAVLEEMLYDEEVEKA